MRHSFTLRIAPGKEAEYRRRHEQIWPGLVEAMRAAGIRNFTLFVRGRDVFGYFEREDSGGAMTLDEFDELGVSRRWASSMADVLIDEPAGAPVEVLHLD